MAQWIKNLPEMQEMQETWTPAAVVRVAGKYRYKMLVKSRNTKQARDMVRHLLRAIHDDPVARGVTVYVDINPASML